MPDAFLERVRPITMPLALCSHIFAHNRRVSKDPVPVCLQAGTAAVIVTLRLASTSIGARLHLWCSLCLQDDADTDKDRTVNFLLHLDTGAEQVGTGNRRSVFYGQSSLKTLLIWMSSVSHRYYYNQSFLSNFLIWAAGVLPAV